MFMRCPSVCACLRLYVHAREVQYSDRPVAAGRGAGPSGACAPGGTVQVAAFGGAKIWNSETWPLP